eukprot:1444715-Prymnesium_polylepis.1
MFRCAVSSSCQLDVRLMDGARCRAAPAGAEATGERSHDRSMTVKAVHVAIARYCSLYCVHSSYGFTVHRTTSSHEK